MIQVKHIILYLILISGLISCENEKKYPKSSTPCIQLQQFTVELKKMGWVSDTMRIKKNGSYGLDKDELSVFKQKPYYRVTFKNSDLYHIYKLNGYRDVDIELFEKVLNIWRYFYRDKNGKMVISDGIIEQWEFPTESDAEKALEQYSKVGDDVYFNTMPYFCRINNNLFVFHTRAWMFSEEQKPLYEKFNKMFNATIINKLERQ